MRTERFDLNSDGSARLMVDIYDEKPADSKAPALIYVPGGAFMMCVETDRGEIASRLVERGFRVSCTYVYPVGRAYRFPQVTIDLMKAIKLVRDHSEEWSVDPDRIVIGGGSAGAFICMTCGNLWNRPDLMEAAGCTGEEGKPNAMVLGFGPMFCGQQTADAQLTYVANGDLVGNQTPPAFFHHARKDALVSVYQTIAMLDAMERHKRPFGVYISSNGDHGDTSSQKRYLEKDGTASPCVDDWFPGCWQFLQNELGMRQDVGEREPMVMPPLSCEIPIVPEGSVPTKFEDMPFGQADDLHMPFSTRFFDKDFDVYK